MLSGVGLKGNQFWIGELQYREDGTGGKHQNEPVGVKNQRWVFKGQNGQYKAADGK